MSLQTYTIEVKTDLNDEQHDAMTEVTKQIARQLFSAAMLLSGGKLPLIACRTTDAFYDSAEIEALEDESND